jgi:hypothetical protein
MVLYMMDVSPGCVSVIAELKKHFLASVSAAETPQVADVFVARWSQRRTAFTMAMEAKAHSTAFGST